MTSALNATLGSDAIDTKYHEANKLLLRLRREVTEKLDPSTSSLQTHNTSLHHRGGGGGGGGGGGLTSDEEALHSLMVDINALSRKIADLDPLIAPLYAAKKQFWTAKVRSLVDECKALRETLDRFLRAKNARSQADHERAKLFAGATSGSSSGLQNLLAESTSLSSSNRMLADLEQVGANIVASLVTQNEMIKRAHQRVLDMGHSMGVSRSLMRMIERRQFFDKLVVYGGMVLTTLLIGAMWWYLY